MPRGGLLEQDGDLVGGDGGHPLPHARAAREQRGGRVHVAVRALGGAGEPA